MPIDLDSVALADLRRRRSAKWTAYPEDVIPAWVAESDFPLAAPIHGRLRAAIDAGDLGYPAPDRSGVRESLAAWVAREQGWQLDPEAIMVVPDAVRGIELALLAHTQPGDAVAIPTPVYPPFLKIVEEHGRRVAPVALLQHDGAFAQDLDGLAAALAAGARMVLLCHPHNPTGHVHERADLEALAGLAIEHGAVVISDEIHSPMTLDARPHVPLATVSDAAAACTITVTSPSKTWNLAGLRAAFVIASEPALADPIRAMGPHALMGCSILGLEASIAAFDEGGPWREALLAVLARNRDTVVRELARFAPAIAVAPPAATYLAWLDCNALDLPGGPQPFFLEHARVALSDGVPFGPGGEGCVRLNFGTTGPILDEILTRLEGALASR